MWNFDRGESENRHPGRDEPQAIIIQVPSTYMPSLEAEPQSLHLLWLAIYFGSRCFDVNQAILKNLSKNSFPLNEQHTLLLQHTKDYLTSQGVGYIGRDRYRDYMA